MIAADTQQNILVTLMLLVEHNFLAITFLLGILVSIGLAIYRPTRGAVLMIVGFSLLLFAFEYHKHIAEPLIEQTKGSLITERQSFRLAWLVEKILGRAVTPLAYLAGMVSVGVGGFLMKREWHKKH